MNTTVLAGIPCYFSMESCYIDCWCQVGWEFATRRLSILLLPRTTLQEWGFVLMNGRSPVFLGGTVHRYVLYVGSAMKAALLHPMSVVGVFVAEVMRRIHTTDAC
ncbi:unnamed protein product [Ectocarpus sp. 12 AP-2014]